VKSKLKTREIPTIHPAISMTSSASQLLDRLEDIEGCAKSGGDINWSRDCQLVDDVVSMMEWWVCFDRKPARKPTKDAPDELAKLLETREFPSRPVVPPPPKYQGVTRNDPCPCGSGRKFKKCCGG